MIRNIFHYPIRHTVFRGFCTMNFSQDTAYYDPYRIINAEKQEDFKSIKKKYLKLIAKYHPDINDADNAPEMFKVIQESYERIKELRGLSTRKSQVRDPKDNDGFQSVRPNAEQYNENFEKFKETYYNFDAAEHYYNLKNDPNYAKYAKSFKEIHEMKETKQKFSLLGDLKNTLSRFKLDELQMRLTYQEKSGKFYTHMIYVLFVMIIMFAFSTGLKSTEQEKNIESHDAFKDIVSIQDDAKDYQISEGVLKKHHEKRLNQQKKKLMYDGLREDILINSNKSIKDQAVPNYMTYLDVDETIERDTENSN